MSEKINMNWKSDSFTVYALNERGVNDFSFHVQGNGKQGYSPRNLEKVVSMAEAAPDMYRALGNLLERVKNDAEAKGWFINEQVEAMKALAKADGEQHD